MEVHVHDAESSYAVDNVFAAEGVVFEEPFLRFIELILGRKVVVSREEELLWHSVAEAPGRRLPQPAKLVRREGQTRDPIRLRTRRPAHPESSAPWRPLVLAERVGALSPLE